MGVDHSKAALGAQRFDVTRRDSPAIEERDLANVGSGNADHNLTTAPKSLSISTDFLPLRFPSGQVEDTRISRWRHAIDEDTLASDNFCLDGPLPDDTLTLVDALDRHLIFKEPRNTSEDTPTPPSSPKGRSAPLLAPRPRCMDASGLSMLSLLHPDSDQSRPWSRPITPTPMSPGWFPLPTASSSIGFWPSMPASPREWFSSRPGSPSVAPYHDLLSALSCPTSPLLGRSNPPPESPGHATLSGVGRKLRSLGSSGNDVREASPPPSRAMSPILRPITPLVQALGMDNWAPERDPTEGIDVIEIMVTKEIIVHYGSVGEAAA